MVNTKTKQCWIDVQGGFVQQASDGEVGHHQPVQLMANQVWRFAPEEGLAPFEMGFEFIEGHVPPGPLHGVMGLAGLTAPRAWEVRPRGEVDQQVQSMALRVELEVLDLPRGLKAECHGQEGCHIHGPSFWGVTNVTGIPSGNQHGRRNHHIACRRAQEC